MINVTSKLNNGVNTIYLEGRLDSTNATVAETQIVELDTEDSLVIDVEKLEYISSVGLRIMLRLRKKHADLAIVNASTEVYDIFDMTGFTDMMKISRAYRTINVDGCEVIGQGANGKVYRIDPDTVVKVYLNPDSLADIEHERDVAKKALILGIPTAISYDVVKVGDHYASMFEMLNAKSFSKLLATNPENVDEYAVMYVDLMKLIHGTLVPRGQLPDQREVAIGWTKFLKDYLPADIYEKLYAMVEAIPYDDHMLHGDYHTKNIMLQNGEVILIDMDTLAVGHPVLELASMYNAYIGFHLNNPEGVKDFLGIDHMTAIRLWKKTLELYYGSTDEAYLADKENKAAVVGLVRLLRRTIRRGNEPELVKTFTDKLCDLVNKVDSLI
ncbi:MAG: phosphotransferase [Clostridia bacterium]|nr:phosphotransferase [Clostridia bacterium]